MKRIIFASEENGYELDNLGTFNTTEEAVVEIKAHLIEDDFCDEEDLENVTEDGFDGCSGQGYHIVYKILDADAPYEDEFDELREEFLEEFED